MKKLLIVSPYFPYPFSTGGEIGVFEMTNYFKNIYEISFVYPSFYKKSAKNQKILQSKWPEVQFLPFKRTFSQRVKNALFYRLQHLFFDYLKRRSFKNAIWYNKSDLIENAFMVTNHICDEDFVDHINNLLKCNRFDLIQIEFYENISLASFLKTNIPVIFVHHELRFVKFAREIKTLFPKDLYLSAFIEQNKAYEIAMLKHYNKVVVLSENDKKILSEHINEEKLYCSPLSINISIKKDNNHQFNNRITFLGGEEHYPNKDGLIWFLKTCFPKLQQTNHQIILQVIGNWHQETIKKYTSEQVCFSGFIEDLSSVLSNSIMIVPIRIGSGIRMKILEAVNLGIPFVTTSIGVEGLNFKDNHDCFIADTPHDFVEKLSVLIEDEELQQSFVKHSYDTFRKLHSFDIAVEKRQRLYNELFL